MISLPGQRPDPRSSLKKHLDANGPASKPPVCPFGCTEEHMDDLGYCEHLIGFTNCRLPEGEITKPVSDNDDDAFVELLEWRKGRREIHGRRCDLEKGDHLVRITISRRVYRKKSHPLAKRAADKVPVHETADDEADVLAR